MDKIIQKSYFVFLLALPLAFYPGLFDPVLLPRQVLLTFFLLFIFMSCFFSGNKIEISKNAAFLAFAIFIFFNLISTLSANVASESIEAIIKYCSYFLFFWITAELLRSRKISEKYIYTAVMLFGMIAILTGLLQIAIKTSYNVHIFRAIQIIYGNFGNKNLLASILFLCFPFFLGGSSFSKFHKTFSIAAMVMAFAILIVIRTRTVFIASAIYVLICLVFYLRMRNINWKNIIWAGLFAVGTGAFATTFIFRKYVPKLASSPDIRRQYLFRIFDSQTFESRIDIWQNSLKMFSDHPIFGVGPGNWQIYFPKYGLSALRWEGIENGILSIQRPHNDFIWILCETGVFGFLAYLSIFITIIYQLLRLIKSAEYVRKWRFIHLISAVSGYIIIAFFDFPLERNEHQILLMLIFALTAYNYFRNEQIQMFNPGKRLTIGAVALSLFFCFFSAARMSSSIHSESARLASAKSDWAAMAFEARKSKTRLFVLDPLTIPVEWYEGAAEFQSGSNNFGQDHFANALKVTPYNIRVIHDLASAFEKNGNHQEAIRLYRQALKISPKFEEARINLAAAYFNSGLFDMSFSTIDVVDIACTLPNYKIFLAPIIEKKINSVLKNVSPEIVARWQQRLRTPQDLLDLYFASKKNNSTFTDYILKTNLI